MIRSPKSPGVHLIAPCKGFRNADPQRNAMGQSTEMPLLVSMVLQTFLNSLEILMELFNYARTVN